MPSARRDTIACHRLADTPEWGVLRPIVDEVLDIVRMDCSACHAQDRDPHGLWRPAVVRVRDGRLTTRCDACGGDPRP
jgi:hypothetical protein